MSNPVVMKVANPDNIRVALECAHPSNVANSSHALYGKGIVAGTIATLMSVTGCSLKAAITFVRRLDVEIDPRCVPPAWTTSFGIKKVHSRAYTTIGYVRGQCKHVHENRVSAQKCVEDDNNACRQSHGFSDRRVVVIGEDGYLYEDDDCTTYVPGNGGKTSGAAKFAEKIPVGKVLSWND